MTAREFLEGIREETKALEGVELRRDFYMGMATRITGSMDSDRVQGDPAHSKVEEYVCMMIDHEAEDAQRMDALILAREKADGIIQRMDSPRCKCILRLRYFEGRTWMQIGRWIGHHERTAQDLHIKALEQFKQIYHECSSIP